MPKHKLYENVCLEKIRSVVQNVMLLQTDLTVLICTVH